MDALTKQQIATRFAVISSFGQSNVPVTADRVQVDTTRPNSRTRAEVSSIGSSLTVNPSFFPTAEVEKRIVTYTHEIAHLGQTVDTHHKPAFWEAFATILTEILNSEQAKKTIQSVFTDEIDWEKVQYRAVQDVAEPSVDGRIETVDERKRKFANAIGYGTNTAEDFELTRYSWYSGNPTVMFYDDEYSVSVPKDEFPVTASEYTDEDFRAFIEEQGIVQDESHISFTAPVTFEKYGNRDFVDFDYARKLCAFADRIGMDYCPMTKASAVVDGVLEREVTDEEKRICERAVERTPSYSEV